MTQEDKDLLLKDLCTRLPYGVKVRAWRRHSEGDPTTIGYPLTLDFIMMSIMFKDNIEEYKPYLFPLSSMTDDHRLEIEILIDGQIGIDTYSIWDYSGYSKLLVSRTLEVFDWLNKNHFDYRGLISKGLAIDATGLNIY